MAENGVWDFEAQKSQRFWALKSLPPIHCHYTAYESQDIFNITMIAFIWKKKVIYT